MQKYIKQKLCCSKELQTLRNARRRSHCNEEHDDSGEIHTCMVPTVAKMEMYMNFVYGIST
jgi:hypothetical protein